MKVGDLAMYTEREAKVHNPPVPVVILQVDTSKKKDAYVVMNDGITWWADRHELSALNQITEEDSMAINGKDNPSFRNEKNGWVKHFAFNWVGGGYNDVWASNQHEAVILANAWFGNGPAELRVNETTVRDITGKENEYNKSLPYWD